MSDDMNFSDQENKSTWYKLLLTPDLSEEAEKTDAQERTEGRARTRTTKVLSDEVA